MKKQSLAFVALVFIVGAFSFSSCKKINEATELGSDLIPPIDNVHTFEAFLETESNNVDMFPGDTTLLLYGDLVAVGHINNDPEFGQTHANAYFSISSKTYGTYPFVDKATVNIDSVVLSLAYAGGYADTNAFQTVRIFEIAPTASFNDTTLYEYANEDVVTTGNELGSKTFLPTRLKDSIKIIRKDTQTVANVLRIKLDNNLGYRLAGYDTSNTSNGGFKNDSIFKTLFKGLAIKADQTGNTITYFNLFDQTKTTLSVYFTYTKDSKKDTATATFAHAPIPVTNSFTHPGGVMNSVKRTKGGNWALYSNNGASKDDKLYIQSAPGSYAAIKVPALDTMTNKVIHLAELVVSKLPSASETIFSTPTRLFLDHKTAHSNGTDTALLFERDVLDPSGQRNLSVFGGILENNQYRFNITRYVQGVITRKDPNDSLRLYAPLRSNLFDKSTNSITSVPVGGAIGYGRVVVAGGNYGDPTMRLRLRIVYSKL